MKTVLVYSGKGGVGKTTTTSHVARALLDMGKKVVILDGDINTPSMSVIFENAHPEENLWIHSTGHIFDSMLYFEKSIIRLFINDAIKLCKDVKPDVVLIDTPPSLTDVHIEIMELMKMSAILLITQPSKLSASDVIRTHNFFVEKNKDAPVYVIENMSFGENPKISLPVKVTIPFVDGMKGELLYEKYSAEYKELARLCLTAGDVDVKITSNVIFDESYIVTDIKHSYVRNKMITLLSCKYDDGTEKLRQLTKKLCFQNVRSWEFIRGILIEENSRSPFTYMDSTLSELTVERVTRLVEAFKDDAEAYFMITKAPNTSVAVFPGEIGRAIMICDEKFFGVPRVQYQTKQGSVTLFAYEVLPVKMNDLVEYIKEGYKIQPDGRYIPTKDHLETLYNTFGSRVGLFSNWEKKYDSMY